MSMLTALGLVACLVGSHSETIDPSTSNPARMVVRRPGGHHDETGGTLISDPSAHEIRFERNKGVVVDIPYARVTALHAEDARALHLSRVHDYYFVVHYTGAVGEPKSLVVRLGSRTEYEGLVSLLERDIQQKVSRSPGWHSIAGVPIYAAVGEGVVAMTPQGIRSGTLTAMSSDSVTIEGIGSARQFDASTLPVLRRPFQLGPVVKKAFLTGVVIGAGAGVFFVYSASEHEWHPGSGALAAVYFGAIFGGGFAFGAATSAPRSYATNPSYDIYRGSTSKSAAPSFAFAPVLSKETKAVNVVIRWQ